MQKTSSLILHSLFLVNNTGEVMKMGVKNVIMEVTYFLNSLMFSFLFCYHNFLH